MVLPETRACGLCVLRPWRMSDHVIARALGDQRGRHHHAALTQRSDLAVHPERARACLVDEHSLATPGLLFPHHLEQRHPVPADLPQAAHLAAELSESDIDRLLVHIHAHENLARLFHGLPPFSVFAPPCQTRGSARSSRIARYRGGGPPALERKPFCIECKATAVSINKCYSKYLHTT